MLDLALLVESVEAVRPAGAGRIDSRAPWSGRRSPRRVAATAIVSAVKRSWRLRLSSNDDDFRRPTSCLAAATFDVAADARVVRIDRNTRFGRVLLLGAADKRPVGMVASAYLKL